MDGQQPIFGPFRFDETNECLWRGSQAIPLRPKAFAVLKYLISHKGVLVTKQQLLNDVWPRTYVSEAVLKDCIRQLRHALNDDAKTPQFIETSHRRGYRFIASLTETKPSPGPIETVAATPVSPYIESPTKLLGRDAALAQLRQCLETALTGNSQSVFVTGEAGIGKTTLVEAFLEQLGPTICILRGQCLEQYGSSEAYLPILDALSRLEEDEDSQIIEALRNCAPTWILQIPHLTTVSEREGISGVTRERMLREIAEALELITTTTPV